MSSGHSEKWYFIDVGKRRGPNSTKQLREFYLNGDIHEQTLIWKSGFETWSAFTRVFPDAEKPRNTKEAAALEKKRAKLELTPKNLTCSVCQKPWPSQYVLALRDAWVCLSCKARLDQEAIQTFDPTKLPKGGLPWPLLIVFVAIIGWFLADYKMREGQEKRRLEDAQRQALVEKTKRFEDPLLLWRGAARNSQPDEPWMKDPPSKWPQLVGTNAAQVGRDYRISGGNCVFIGSSSDLVAITPLEIMHPHVAHYLRTLPEVPPAFFSNWMIEGAPAKPAWLAQRFCRPEDLADRDLMPFVVRGSKGQIHVPAVPLQVRAHPLREKDRVWIVVFDPEAQVVNLASTESKTAVPATAALANPSSPTASPQAAPSSARQKVLLGTIRYLLEKGKRFEATLDSPYPLGRLAGAPLLDEHGWLAGIVTMPGEGAVSQMTDWISGQTSTSIAELLARTRPTETPAP